MRSSNCVVDTRFVVKLTDFGLHAFRDTSSEDNDSQTKMKSKESLKEDFNNNIEHIKTNYWRRLVIVTNDCSNQPFNPEIVCW